MVFVTFDPPNFTFKLDTTVCFFALLYANISTYLTSKSCSGFSIDYVCVLELPPAVYELLLGLLC